MIEKQLVSGDVRSAPYILVVVFRHIADRELAGESAKLQGPVGKLVFLYR
jgi:hypothetical protein